MNHEATKDTKEEPTYAPARVIRKERHGLGWLLHLSCGHTVEVVHADDPVLCLTCWRARPHAELVGRYARSIESGWLGKVEAMEVKGGDTMCRMVGVNELYRTLKGGDIEAALDPDDVQWFTPDDLRFLKLV